LSFFILIPRHLPLHVVEGVVDLPEPALDVPDRFVELPHKDDEQHQGDVLKHDPVHKCELVED